MFRMTKTSVYLHPFEVIALRRISIRTGRSQADLLRQGIRLVAFAEIEGRLDIDPPLPRDVFQLHSVAQILDREDQVLVAYVASGCTWDEIADLTGRAEADLAASWSRVWEKLRPLRHPALPQIPDAEEARDLIESLSWGP